MQTKKLSAQDAATLDATKQSLVSVSESRRKKQNTCVTIADFEAVYLNQRQQGILEKRGMNLEFIAKMGWRGTRRGGIGSAIEIPYFRNGKEVNCKTRSIEGDKLFFQVEGGEKCFYNVDAIKDVSDSPLIITEGEMDCIIALQCGHIAISVPDGAPKEAIGDKDTVKYDYLSDIPSSINKIILATDGDNPGANLLNDLALRLGKHRCMWVKYPKGCKDLNDTFMAWGERGVKETLSRAQYMQIDGLYRMNDLPPLPQQEALHIGIDALKDNLKIRRGDLSVVTGVPSMGKTVFTNQLAFNMAKNHGWDVCFASFEQPPQTEHRRSLRTIYSNRPAYLLSSEELAKADEWINEKFSFIVPSDDAEADMTWLTDRMAAAVVRHNAKLIIIDPWNELDHMYNQQQVSLTQYVGQAIKQLKRFAKKFMVHVMVVAHPAKMRRDKDGKYPIPTAYDISDSSHWYNKPEQIVVVHREEHETLIRVAKSRYHNSLGKPGDVKVKYDDYTLTYA